MKHVIWFYLQKFCSRLLIVECDECSNGSGCNQQTGNCNEGYTTDIYNSTKGRFLFHQGVELQCVKCFLTFEVL